MLAPTSSAIAFFIRSVFLAIVLLVVSTTLALPIQNVRLDARGNSPSKPNQCPSVSYIEDHIRKKSGDKISNAVYWSHPGSVANARDFAERVHGHYIYDFVSNNDIADWGKVCSPAERNVLWARASYAFAKLSKGTAYVVTNQNAKADAIWTRYEFPVLKATGLIDTVLSIDPQHNNHGTVIFNKDPSGHKPQFPAEP